MSHVLSCYPLSLPFRLELERRSGEKLEYLTLTELRTQPVVKMLHKLFMVRGSNLRIAIEDDTSKALLPILGLLASITRARRLVIVEEKHTVRRLNRSEAIGSALSVGWESLLAAMSMWRGHRQMKRLLNAPRIHPRVGVGRRVAYLNCNLWFGVKAGGSVGHISGVVNALTGLGHDVDFYTVGGRLMVNDHARLVPLDPPKSLAMPFERTYFRFDALCERQLARDLAEQQPSFIYQRMSIGNFVGVRLSRQFGIPLIIEYNGSEVWVAKNWGKPLRYEKVGQDAEDVCLRHAHLIVTISDVLAEELMSRGVERERIVVYPNCIDPSMFDPAAFKKGDVDGFRAVLGCGPQNTIATFIGTFGQWHGVDVLARAIAAMVESHPHLFESGLRFVLVGDGQKMPLVREILSPPHVAKVVTLTGLVPQKDAPRYLASSDILLSPHVANADGTKFFGSPTKLFEYMAMARGIVASDLDQLGQVLRPAILVTANGDIDMSQASSAIAVLTPPGDIAAMASAIELLVRNVRLRQELGLNARTVALSRYTWRHHVQAILEGLDRAANRVQ